MNNEQTQNGKLIEYFLQLNTTDQSPYSLSLDNFDQLINSATDADEEILFLLEDTIFTSLYVTYFEHVLNAINQNPTIAHKLIENFSEEASEREQQLANEAQSHLNYILQDGECQGCSSCENHQDIQGLISLWNQADTNFFAQLYIGMQTIQFTMEALLFDGVLNTPQIISFITPESILKLRKFITNFCETTQE